MELFIIMEKINEETIKPFDDLEITGLDIIEVTGVISAHGTGTSRGSNGTYL